MKKFTLLFALLLVLGMGQIFGQACTPNNLLVQIGIPGVYPNPVQQTSLTSGSVGNAYSETFTIIVIPDTTIDLSSVIGFPVPPVDVSVAYNRVNAINGLPTGLTHACSPSDCIIPGDSAGCAIITGTPTQSGTFTVEMDMDLGVEVPPTVPVVGGTTVDLPVPGLSWELEITGGVSVDEQFDNVFSEVRNVPNPFSGTTDILFELNKPADIVFEVYDLSGQRLHSVTQKGRSGENQVRFDGSELAPGLYLYSLSSGDRSVTRKMVVAQ